LLPLSQDVRKIALIGPLADDPESMLGSWIAQTESKDAVTLRAELSRRIGDSRVVYEQGTGFTEGSDSKMKSAVDVAANADLTILALGERTHDMTGEAASRAHLDLPGRQQELLEKVVATGKPVVLILFSGRPLTLPWAFDHVPAVLAAWAPGIQAGPALAKILFGDSNPSAKLVVSWPRSVGQEPLYYNALSTGRPARNVDLTKYPETHGEKYISRYLDEVNAPQFPFGFGLSYTSFRYGATTLSRTQLGSSDLVRKLKNNESVLTASADVTNMGARPGEEVVELYIRLEGTSVAQPVRALKAFTRISLKPGETRNVAFQLPADTFALWDDQNKFTVEPAKITIWVSPDSSSGTPVNLQIGK
jgi:beta-glucosidase